MQRKKERKEERKEERKKGNFKYQDPNQHININNRSITKDLFFPDVHSRLKCTLFLLIL
jgi:hypothetical protein